MNESRNSDNKLENVYLKFFKYAMVVLMTLSLVAILVLLPMAAYNFFQSPVPAAPAKEPPQRSITIDDLKKYLIDEENRRIEQEKGGNAPKPAAVNPAAVTQRYLEQAIALYRCSEDFAKLAEQPTDNSSELAIAQGNERMRSAIESMSDQRYRGPEWVKSMVDFTCSVLRNPEIAKLKKDKAVGSVVGPTVRFHANAWTAIEQEKSEFRQREQARIASENNSETLRVALAKGKAAMMLGTAGALLGFFLLLALYLIFAKIEDNLRLIHKSIARHEVTPA